MRKREIVWNVTKSLRDKIWGYDEPANQAPVPTLERNKAPINQSTIEKSDSTFSDPLASTQEEVQMAVSPPGKAELVLNSLLSIHLSIQDSDALVGYEGLPLQVEKIYWEIWGVIAKNPELTEEQQVVEKWMEFYVEGWEMTWD
jgi:hypothetical protein